MGTARIACITLVAALALLACNGAKSPTSDVDGKVVYDKYCALCHGEAGVGYAADNATALANPDFLSVASDGFLWTAIERGRPGTAMAGYGKKRGGPLGRPEMAALLRYLRSLQKEPAIDVDDVKVNGDPERAKPIYQQKCSACHGAHGEGVTAVSLNNPLFLVSASDGFLRHAIDKGRRGTQMGAYGKHLAPQDIDDLVSLIRSWARHVDDSPVGGVPPTFAELVVNPTGPAPQFSPLREGRYVPADEVSAALARGARMVFLDARPTSDWLQAHIPGALPVPYYDAEKMVDALPRDGTWIISYCACPHAASGHVMDALRAQGFENTAVIDEGIIEWMKRGYPVSTGSAP